MTDRLEFEHLLHELYAARLHGLLDRLCGLFAQDANFRIVGASDGQPIAVSAAGIDAIRPWLGMMVKTFRLTNHKILTSVIEGDRAAVHWSADIHSRITGALVSTELIDMVVIRGARIASYTELFVPR
jgi:ketosteroid isomerase-like protein